MQVKLGQPVICVVGLGYVGLPLAEAFSRHFKVIGFDTNKNRVMEPEAHNSGFLISNWVHRQALMLRIASKAPCLATLDGADLRNLMGENVREVLKLQLD